MRPNTTFFIQIINLGITYWFLNKFMFKPVIEFLRKKKIKESRIERSIYKKEQFLLHMEEEKHLELENFQDLMKKKYRFILPEKFKIPTSIPYKVDEKEAAIIIKVATEMFIKRVPHVD